MVMMATARGTRIMIIVIKDIMAITRTTLTWIIINLFVYMTMLHVYTSNMGSNSQKDNSYRSSDASLGDLKLLSWNATGIMSSGSYLGRTLEQFSVDICGVGGHWLYKTDLYFLDSSNSAYKYTTVSDSGLEKPSKRKVGKGDLAIFWKQSTDSRVCLLNIDDDRILVIQYQMSKDNFV